VHGAAGRLADLTDHVISARVAPHRFFDETNLQSLCVDCHRLKSIAEDGTLGHNRM